jgi:diamine N-acetyltransferase
MIDGKNITLRALELADAELLYNWENDTSLWHMSNTLTPFSKFTLEQYILNAHQDIYTIKQLRLMIDLKENKSSIGSIDLFDFDPMHKRAGVGILILEEYRGKGYASEALDMIIRYAFNTLHLHQLFCNIGSANAQSLKLFRKKNFEVVARKRDWVFRNGEWEDEFFLQLINNTQKDGKAEKG